MFKKILTETVEMVEGLKWLEPDVERVSDLIATAFRNGSKLLICGNGGSASDSAHFATEWLCRFEQDRRPFPAIALTSEGGLLTAIGNDYASDEVFARQVRGLGLPGDVLVVLTTSGNSPNVIRALAAAKECGLSSVAMLGRDGGNAKGLATIDLIVPVQRTARIQEGHKILIHAICAMVEERLVD